MCLCKAARLTFGFDSLYSKSSLLVFAPSSASYGVRGNAHGQYQIGARLLRSLSEFVVAGDSGGAGDGDGCGGGGEHRCFRTWILSLNGWEPELNM